MSIVDIINTIITMTSGVVVYHYSKKFYYNHLKQKRCDCKNCKLSRDSNSGYAPCLIFDTHGLPIVSDSPPMPKCKPPKTDFTEMCENCFSSMISKMPMRTICNLKEVERQRMMGCRHGVKSIEAIAHSEARK